MEIVELLVILGAIYLYECAQWVPLEAVGFYSHLPWRMRASHPWEISAGRSKGILAGAPLPPLTPAFITEPLPVVLGPRGICPRRDPSRYLPWKEVSEAAAGGCDLYLNGAPYVAASSKRLADALARLVAEVRRLDEPARAKRISAFLDRRFDQGTVTDRLRAFEDKTLVLSLGQNLLFVSVFLGIPAVGLTSFVYYWPAVPIAAIVGIVTTAVCFRRVVRRSGLLPAEARPDRVHRILVAISPLSTMRARDLLGRELLSDLDPLAVSSVLLGRGDFRERARLFLGELTHLGVLRDERPAEDDAGRPEARDAAAEEASWLRDRLVERLRRLLAYKEVELDPLLAPPPREADEVTVYCPLCLGQYSKGEACPQFACRGVKLIPFGK